MKKITALVLALCMIFTTANIYARTDEAAESLVISKPILSNNAVNQGVNSYEALVYNPTDKDITVRMTVKLYDTSDLEVSSNYVSTEIKANERKMLIAGFNAKSDGGRAECIFTNEKTNEKYQPTDTATDIDFNIIYTNIDQKIDTNENIIFEFNSEININSENIELTDGSRNIDKTVIIEKTKNGCSKITLKPKNSLMADKRYTVRILEITDIFGRKIQKSEYTFKTKKVREHFEIIQKSSVLSKESVGGFAMLAEFKDGNPGSIYFSRKTNTLSSPDSPFKASAVAEVLDPNGDVACVYDFSNQRVQNAEVALDVPYSMDGVWQIKFMSSKNGDVLEIGLNNALNWGVRGEYMIGSDNNIAREGYVYIPEKVDSLYVGITDSAYPAKIYKESGEIVGETENESYGLIKSKKQIDNIDGEAVYKIEFAKNGKYGILIDIAPSLICPTREMALALKGGWVDCDGTLVQGALQAQARKEILRIINENNLELNVTYPNYSYHTGLVDGQPLQNRRLEAYIATSRKMNVTNVLEQQNLDTKSPLCGSFVSKSEKCYENGTFVVLGAEGVMSVFPAAVNLEGQLNPYYRNKALADRAALAILANAVSLSEDLMIKDNDVSADGAITHGNFYYCWVATAYMEVRSMLDEATVRVLDKVMRQLAYNQGTMKGRGPSNQWFFTVNGVMASRYTTNDEIVKGIFERHLEAMSDYAINGKGLSKGGYFIEQGCDGDYHNLSRNLYYEVYKTVQRLEPNNKYLTAIKNKIQENMEFLSMIELPSGGAKIYGTNAATSRKLGSLGCDTHRTYTLIFDEFPLAARKFEMTDALRSTASINEALTKYGNVYYWSKIMTRGGLNEYNAYKNYGKVEAEPIPAEYEKGIWQKDGMLSVKHKGLYMNIFYALAEEYVPSMSFMGGGISLLYADDVGGVISSRKPAGYGNITDYSQITSTCMFGKKEDGSLNMTGKEVADFEWLIKDRKFKISGVTPNNINSSWTYTLNSEGIRLLAETDLDEAWLNIPLSYSGDDVTLTHKNGSLYYTYNESSVELKWDESSEYYVTELTDEEGKKIHVLRIKMNLGKCVLDIKNNTVASESVVVKDYNLTKTDEEKSVTAAYTDKISGANVVVVNNDASIKKVELIYAVYSSDGVLKRLVTDKKTLAGGEEKTLSVENVLSEQTDKIKIMIWDSLNIMSTYDEQIYIETENENEA